MEEDSSQLILNLTRQGNMDQEVGVVCATEADTAIANDDYVSRPHDSLGSEVMFGVNQSLAQCVVGIIDDEALEPRERFHVYLTASSRHSAVNIDHTSSSICIHIRYAENDGECYLTHIHTLHTHTYTMLSHTHTYTTHTYIHYAISHTYIHYAISHTYIHYSISHTYIHYAISHTYIHYAISHTYIHYAISHTYIHYAISHTYIHYAISHIHTLCETCYLTHICTQYFIIHVTDVHHYLQVTLLVLGSDL